MFDQDPFNTEQDLGEWLMHKLEGWRNHYDGDYRHKHEEYYRLWRGIHSPQDQMRASERAKIISPALQQAVESAVAEIEEATFGHSKWFDIEDDVADKDDKDIRILRKKLQEDMKYAKAKKSLCDVLLNSAVYGVGIGEITVDMDKSYSPASKPILGGELQEVGVQENERFLCRLNPVLPQNFLIDPNADNVHDALGVAVDKFVPIHQVEQMITRGVYRDVPVYPASPDSDIEPDQDLVLYQEDKVRLIRYYGLVPKHLLEMELGEKDGETQESTKERDEKAQKETDQVLEQNGRARNVQEYEEAIVVIMNDGIILKAERSPYMMKDRPILAFSWDTVPGRFWGRGICEKGYNSQKALDTELRARLDALALLVHPMVAADATRLPRGTNLTVRPGKILLTNGRPSEVIESFKMGNLEQLSFTQSQELMKMVQMATGALDSSGLPEATASNNTKTGAMSMSFGAIIKRHKRTLINWQENFLIPFIEKCAWRYMQFNPEEYPVKDFKFCPTTSLGIMARELETNQLVSLLQTTGPESPFYPMLLEKIVENMQVSNRDELVAKIREMQQPNPEAEKSKQMQQQAEMQKFQAELNKVVTETKRIAAEAQKTVVETQLLPQEAKAKFISALSTNIKKGEGDDLEFKRRWDLANLIEKREDRKSNERIVDKQLLTSVKIKEMEIEAKKKEEDALKGVLGGNGQ